MSAEAVVGSSGVKNSQDQPSQQQSTSLPALTQQTPSTKPPSSSPQSHPIEPSQHHHQPQPSNLLGLWEGETERDAIIFNQLTTIQTQLDRVTESSDKTLLIDKLISNPAYVNFLGHVAETYSKHVPNHPKPSDMDVALETAACVEGTKYAAAIIYGRTKDGGTSSSSNWALLHHVPRAPHTPREEYSPIINTTSLLVSYISPALASAHALLNNLIITVRALCVDRDGLVRAQAFRLLRYLCRNDMMVLRMIDARIDFLCGRTLEKETKYLWERMQAMKFVRKLVSSTPHLVTRVLCVSLVALSEHAKDDFRRVALDALRELAFTNPAVVASSNGVRVLVDAMLDPSLADVSSSLTLTLLYLLDQPSTRCYIRENADVLRVLSVYTDLTANPTHEKEGLRLSAHKSLVTMLRSFTGILTLGSNPKGMHALFQVLTLPSQVPGATWARDSVLELLAEVLSVVTSGDLIAFRKSRAIASDNEAAGYMSPSAHARPINLLHTYMAMVLLMLVHCGLVGQLAHLAVSDETEFASVATALLVVILRLACGLLPPTICARLSAMPLLLHNATSPTPVLQNMSQFSRYSTIAYPSLTGRDKWDPLNDFTNTIELGVAAPGMGGGLALGHPALASLGNFGFSAAEHNAAALTMRQQRLHSSPQHIYRASLANPHDDVYTLLHQHEQRRLHELEPGLEKFAPVGGNSAAVVAQLYGASSSRRIRSLRLLNALFVDNLRYFSIASDSTELGFGLPSKGATSGGQDEQWATMLPTLAQLQAAVANREAREKEREKEKEKDKAKEAKDGKDGGGQGGSSSGSSSSSGGPSPAGPSALNAYASLLISLGLYQPVPSSSLGISSTSTTSQLSGPLSPSTTMSYSVMGSSTGSSSTGGSTTSSQSGGSGSGSSSSGPFTHISPNICASANLVNAQPWFSAYGINFGYLAQLSDISGDKDKFQRML